MAREAAPQSSPQPPVLETSAKASPAPDRAQSPPAQQSATQDSPQTAVAVPAVQPSGEEASPEREREMKTWISEDTGPDMTIEAVMSVIAYFRIPPARAKEILGEVSRAVDDWRKTGRGTSMRSRRDRPIPPAKIEIQTWRFPKE